MTDKTEPALEPSGDEVERLRAALQWYGDQFCELGASHECCGRLTADDCAGCFAHQALKGTPA